MERTGTEAIEPTEDAAAYAEMEKEFGDTPVEEPVKEDPAAEKSEETKDKEEEAKDKPPLPYEELEKRYGNLNGALAESRAQQRQMRDQLANMKQVFEQLQSQRVQPQQPPQEQEFIDPLEQRVGEIGQQITQLTKAHTEAQAAAAQQAQHAQMMDQVRSQEQAFAQDNPDYFDAVNHLRTARMAELEVLMPDADEGAMYQAINAGYQSPAQMREAIVSQEANSILQRAADSRVNPAQLVYQLAQNRGYQKAQPAPQPQAQQMQAVKQARSEAPESLSAGGATAGNADGMPTVDELAEMYVSDPDKADAMFQKMKSAGLLG